MRPEHEISKPGGGRDGVTFRCERLIRAASRRGGLAGILSGHNGGMGELPKSGKPPSTIVYKVKNRPLSAGQPYPICFVPMLIETAMVWK
jgi:hypothetical protein